jgi:hypothetical protein
MIRSLTDMPLQGTHITGHFSSPNGGADLDVAVNPAWRDSVLDLIPYTPYPDGSSKEVIEASAAHMTNTVMGALKGIAPESGAYLNEVSV